MKQAKIKKIKIVDSHSLNSNSLLLVNDNNEQNINNALIINNKTSVIKQSNYYSDKICHTQENVKKNENVIASYNNKSYDNRNNKTFSSIINKTDDSFNIKEEEKDVVNPILYNDITKQKDKLLPLTIGIKTENNEINDINECDALTLWKKTLRSAKGISAMKKVVDKYKLKQQQKNRQSILKNLALIENDFMPKQDISFQKEKCKVPVLHPESLVIVCWNIIISILMLYTAIIMPYRIAFIESDSSFWKIFETVIDFLFLFDIFITFNIGYYDENNDLIVDRKKIAINYIMSWFALDLITSLPQNLIFNTKSSKLQKGTDLLRLMKIAKLNRLIRVFRFMKLAKFLRKFQFFDNIYEKIKINFGMSKLISFIFQMILVFHVVACLWYFLSKLYNEENNWFVHIGVRDDNNIRKYFFSLYWTITTVFTMGFGDIHAYNSLENAFSIIWMVFGVIFFSIIIGTLSSIIANSESRETILKKKLQILEDFAKKTSLSQSLKRKITFVLLFNSKNEQSINNYNLLNEIPSDLKYQVATAVQQGYLKDIVFLSQIMYPNFIAVIIQFLTPVIFIENEIVYEVGDTPRFMYFILKGRIKFFTNERIPYCTYHTGAHFGEIDINEQQRIHNVISTENSDFLSLSKKHFNEIFGKDFQEIYMQLVFLARKRKLRLEKLAHIVTEKYFNDSYDFEDDSSGIDDSFSDEDDIYSEKEEQKIEKMIENNKIKAKNSRISNISGELIN